MDGARLCGDGAVLFYPWRDRYPRGDRSVSFKLCDLLPVLEKYEEIFAERKGAQGKIQTPVCAAYALFQRGKAQVRRVRQD